MLQSHHSRILITGGVAGDCSLGVTAKGAHPGGTVGYWGGKESRGGGGGSVVENYTTSINHFYTTGFLSISCFPHLRHIFSRFPLHHGRASPSPQLHSHPDAPPRLSALYSSLSPWPCALLKPCWSPSLAPLSIHLNFISTVVCLHAFFIDLLFVAYRGFIPLAMRLD